MPIVLINDGTSSQDISLDPILSKFQDMRSQSLCSEVLLKKRSAFLPKQELLEVIPVLL
jgi:hypothetical protein